MSNLAHSPLPASSNATVMETIMKPLSYARRPARWLMAAGLALAAMHRLHARAQARTGSGRGLNDRSGAAPQSRAPAMRRPSSRRPASSATATTSSTSCASARGATRPSSWIPAFDGRPENSSAWTSATRCRQVWRSSTSRCPGDGTDAVRRTASCGIHLDIGQPQRHGDGRRLPPDHRRSRRVGAKSTAATSHFVITAKIDHAAFPAPTIVDNQGFVTLRRRRPHDRGSLARSGTARRWRLS